MLARNLQYAFWILPALLQLAMIVIMVQRRLRTEYPMFYSYTIFQVASFVCLFAAYRFWPREYPYAYWTSGAISVGLGFAVIREIFIGVFRPYDGLRDFGGLLFRWAGLVLLLMGIVVGASSLGSQTQQLIAAIQSLERSVRLMQCGFLMFLFLFSSYVGISWRHRIFGIALGFGTFAMVDLSVFTLWGRFGTEGHIVLSMLKSSAYTGASLIWFGYLLLPQPAQQPILEDFAPAFDKWNQALVATMNPSDAPFMPRIEETVDRILNRDRYQ